MNHNQTITSLEVLDIRYPTVRLGLAGSDPRHLAPNYSCAIPILRTDGGLEGRALVFTIGDGTQIQKTAIEALGRFVVGRKLRDFIAEPGLFAQALAEHHQLRWLALGTYRMAVGGIINALWDLWAKVEDVSMWRLLTSLPPERIVECIDFHHLRDALTEDELLEMLRQREPTKQANLERLERQGVRVYSTAGWSGRPLDEVRRLCNGLYRQGTRAFKAKVGRGQQYDRSRALDEDRRMLDAIRESTGEDARLLTDANQNLGDWRNAAGYMTDLAKYQPMFIEEAIAYNDVLGYIELRKALAPLGIGVAGGEQAPDAVTFKQLLAGGGLTHCQIDGARVGGVNELFAIIGMAAKFGVPVCPHSGGIGLGQLVGPLAAFDQAWFGSEGRWLEYLEFLQAGVFKQPLQVRDGHYQLLPSTGWGLEMEEEFVARYRYPDGPDTADSLEADREAAVQPGAPPYARYWA
ncbi:MAG: mandelate racemase/muconate lactonizing enzyme domain-containing protein [Bryobacterales bacterium]|nr:mandelate racemase/muconate lactonizing enzyme domain-containing protein [Bryobacterales bacterium]